MEKVELNSHTRMKTLILVDDVNTGTLRMIRFAKTLGHPWSAIHVNFDEIELMPSKPNGMNLSERAN